MLKGGESVYIIVVFKIYIQSLTTMTCENK